MAGTKNSDVVARGDDVALKLSQAGPRDALLDPKPGDYVPDLEAKGYHVGEVAQPAEPVLSRSGDVTFESLPEAPESKFVGGIDDLKAAHNKREATDAQYAGVAHVPADAPEATRPAAKAPAAKAPAASTGSSVVSDLDADSARVAKRATAEDRG